MPTIVLAVGWTICGLMFASVWQRLRMQDGDRFTRFATSAETAIRQRLAIYTDALQAGAAFLRGSNSVDRSEWREFMGTLDIAGRYPGIRGIGVIYPLTDREMEAFVRRVRADGAPDFATHVPSGADNAERDHAIITLIEPLGPNEKALGLDVLQEKNRREAALHSRDTGEPQITRQIALVQDGPAQKGSLLFMPVYRAGVRPVTVVERRAAHVGWVYAPFVFEELLRGALEGRTGRLAVDVFEGDLTDASHLVFRSGTAGASTEPFERVYQLDLGGQRFTLGWSRGPDFAQSVLSPISPFAWTAASGALATVFLAGLVYSLQRTGARARVLADELTRDMATAQQALEASLRLNRAVLDGTVHSVISTTPDGIITTFNSGAERMLGYSRDEVVGRTTPAKFHVEHEIQERADELANVGQRTINVGFETLVAQAQHGGVDEREWTYVRKDGSRLPVLLSVTSLRDSGGALAGYLAIGQDLTDRKKAEISVRATEERLSRVLGHSECLVWEAKVILSPNDWNWRMAVFPSGLYHRLLGQRQPNQEAGLWYQFEVPEQSEMNRRSREAMEKRLPGYVQEFRLVRDGETLWLRESVAISDEGGGHFWLIGVAIEITERKRMEAALRASLQEVTNLQTALDAHAIVAVTDANGVITYANDRFCAVSQYAREEVIGQTHRLIRSGHHDGAFFGEMWNVISSGRIWHGEICNRAKDGTLFWEDATIVPFLGEAGRPVQYIAVRTDITGQKQLEQNLAIARDEALEASRLKSEFLATMSHEIRTPMNAIIGMTEVLNGTPLNAEQSDMLRVVGVAAESLLTIINDILDFSRIEAGQLRLDTADFDLGRIVEETVTLLAGQAREKHLDLNVDFDPAPTHFLRGDAGRVRQIMLNLLANAVKFTDAGEVVVTGGVVAETPESVRTRIEVRDTGVGIPQDARGRLFRPFVQVDGSATRRFGGTGLGLAITRQLVAAMGGAMDFESEPGRGSTFWVELEFPRRGAIEVEPFPIALDGRRILVLETCATHRAILQRRLTRLGLAVEAWADGNTAMARLSDRGPVPFDAIVLATGPSSATGLNFARSLRAQPPLAAVPIVLLSSIAAIDLAAVRALGTAASLTKPCSALKVARTIARLIAETPAPAEISLPRNPLATNASSLRLLVVEDNAANRQVARTLLEKLGHSVAIAVDGHEALDLLAQSPFDVVLMDCQMPVLDGYETTRRIRSGAIAGVDPRVPIVALTAYARPEDRARCLAAGMNGYVSKPIRGPELVGALHDAVAGRPAADVPPSGGATPVLDSVVLATARNLPGMRGSSLLPELIELYVAEEPIRLGRLAELMAARNGAELAQEAHGFAGNAASFGGIEVRQVALELESAARDGNWPETGKRFTALREACVRLRVALRRAELI